MARDYIAWKPQAHDPRLASVRLRCLNPLAELRSRGYPVELFDSARLRRYAAVVFSKSYDEASYHDALQLKTLGARVAFDLCDNHFFNPKGLDYWRQAGERLRRMMVSADRLLASTDEMAGVMRANLPDARPITVIGDAVEMEIPYYVSPTWERWWHRWKLSRLLRWLEINRRGRVRLVWFGNHGSPYAEGGMLDLLSIRRLLEDLNRRHPLSLTVISNSRQKYQQAIAPWSIPTHYLPWHPHTFFTALRAHSIAVIPITLNPFTRCKGNNRLALSLCMGLAVVADAIPSYEPFADACFLGQWEEGLERYLSDSDLRQKHIQISRDRVSKEYSITRIADQWRGFFDTLFN